MSRDGKHRAYRWGHAAEWLAMAWLICKGYRILEHRCRTRMGEVDIVAFRRDTLVLVEVKARPDMGEALASVTRRQRKRIVRAGNAIVAKRRYLSDCSVRYDVIAVAGPFRVRHIINAWGEEVLDGA